MILEKERAVAGDPDESGSFGKAGYSMISDRMENILESGKSMAELFTAGDRLAKRFGAENVYNFSIGNPNVPAPQSVKETIIDITQNMPETALHSYTKPEGIPDVRKAIAEHDREKFGVDLTEKNIFMVAGAAAGLNAIFLTLLDEGDEVIVPSPYFTEYDAYAASCGAHTIAVPTKPETFDLDVDEIKKAITRRTKIVLINTPNNPTGVIYSEQSLRDLAEVLNEKNKDLGIDIALVSDEPYRELAYAGTAVPFIPKFYDNTIISYSFSKSLSLPGERIGYVTVPDSVTDFGKVTEGLGTACRILFVNAPSLIQRVAGVCIKDACDVEYYERNRDALYEGLKEIGYECVVPQGAFYLWLKTPVEDDREFAKKAEDYQIVIVPGSAFKGPGYVRISFCVAYETIIAALPKFKELYDDIKSGK